MVKVFFFFFSDVLSEQALCGVFGSTMIVLMIWAHILLFKREGTHRLLL